MVPCVFLYLRSCCRLNSGNIPLQHGLSMCESGSQLFMSLVKLEFQLFLPRPRIARILTTSNPRHPPDICLQWWRIRQSVALPAHPGSWVPSQDRRLTSPSGTSASAPTYTTAPSHTHPNIIAMCMPSSRYALVAPSIALIPSCHSPHVLSELHYKYLLPTLWILTTLSFYTSAIQENYIKYIS